MFMKKIYLLFVAAALAACSAEPVETEGIDSLDASVTGKTKATVQDVQESFDVPDQICAGEEAQFCMTFPQKYKGNGSLQTTNVQVQLEVAPGDWEQIYTDDANTESCFSHTFEDDIIYNLRYQIGGGGFTEISVTVEDCGCKESFTYVDNGDMTYTFTYTPEEDMTDVTLSFTFPQANAEFTVEGWEHNGKENSQTWKRMMDLNACTSYEWTVNLTRICMGSTSNNNIWTDFTVDGVSKKGNLANITQSCPE